MKSAREDKKIYTTYVLSVSEQQSAKYLPIRSVQPRAKFSAANDEPDGRMNE